jgi:hypothetical protein
VSTSSIQTVKADSLTVDPRVQRQVDPRRVRHLAEKWDPKMVGVLTVSHRLPGSVKGPDGTVALEEFVVLDGQTRWEAAKIAGVEVLRAEVFEGLSEADEASIFLQHNDRKAITPRDRFRLAVVALDVTALSIRDIAAKHGWYVQGMTPADAAGMRVFTAIGAAEKIYSLDDGKALRKTFDVIERAWGHKPGSVSGETLYGLGLLFAEHPTGIDGTGLVNKLQKLGLNAFISAIGDRRRTHPGMSIRTAAQEWTTELYNRGRRTHRV